MIMAFDFRVNFPHDDHLKINNFKGSTIIANLRGGPVLILVNFRGGPVLILKLFSILVNFRGAPVKKTTTVKQTKGKLVNVIDILYLVAGGRFDI